MLVKSNFFSRHRKLCIIVAICILVAIVGISIFKVKSKKPNAVYARERKTVEVSRGDISVSVSGSGSIESASTKNIASEVSAKVTEVNVAVGDRVTKGDVLFQLDSSSLDTQIRNKQKTVTSYQKSVNEYKEDISNLNVVSDVSGYVSNFKYSIGDTVSKNSVLFDVTDTSKFILNTTFIYNASNPINVGDEAKIFIADTYSYLYGTVSYVSERKDYYEYGGQIQNVEIEVENPGYSLDGIEVSNIIIHTSNGTEIKATDSAKFETQETISFKSKSSGTIKNIYIRNGDLINSGELVILLENDELSEKLSDAQTSLSDAYTELNDMKDDYSFYTITAPIDGVVTNVAVSVDDYVRSESTIAKIVNNYEIEFSIDVDELDILDLEVGQEAKVTIDALEDTTITPLIGNVSEIALEGTTMSSVTTYPVTISLAGNDEIRMGMNCSAEIIVKSAEDVLIVPVEAINTRKDKYYVTMEDGEEREVEVGIYNEDYIEIVSGLTENEKIMLPETVNGSSTTSKKENTNSSSFGGFNMNGGGMQGMSGGGRPDMGGMPGGR